MEFFSFYLLSLFLSLSLADFGEKMIALLYMAAEASIKFSVGSPAYLRCSFCALLRRYLPALVGFVVQKRNTCEFSFSISSSCSLSSCTSAAVAVASSYLPASSLSPFLPKTSCCPAVFTTLLIDGSMWPFKARASAPLWCFSKSARPALKSSPAALFAARRDRLKRERGHRV